jgi:hypothetical protein
MAGWLLEWVDARIYGEINWWLVLVSCALLVCLLIDSLDAMVLEYQLHYCSWKDVQV